VKLNITTEFVQRLQAIRSAGLSEPLIHQAKRCLLDYLGAAFAGAFILREKAGKILEMSPETAAGPTVIGFERKAGLETATLINGLSSHVAEMDDGVRHGMIHPGSPVISALLPVAETRRVQARDLIMGIVVGYEAALRIASAIQPSHYRRGYHPTATCGSIGAAMGLAAMLEFEPRQTENALAAACVSASGSLKVIEDGSELKPFNAGRAALVGLLSAWMGRAGFDAPPDALSGSCGFLAMMSDNYDERRILESCPGGLWIHHAYVKPYAACRHAHPSIEACIRIRRRARILPGEVSEIRVTTYDGLAGKHDHRQVSSVSSARMSIPFSAAIALVTGRAGIDEFTAELIQSPGVKSLASKVYIVADPEFTAQVPAKRAALVEIATTKGLAHKELVEYPKGEPENPLTDGELQDKFESLAKYGRRPAETIWKVANEVWNLAENLEGLFQHL